MLSKKVTAEWNMKKERKGRRRGRVREKSSPGKGHGRRKGPETGSTLALSGAGKPRHTSGLGS